MADIYEWADGRSGRFAVETPLYYPSKLVPRGTGDLLDRRLRAFVDWKFMGTWSLKKLRTSGPSDTYRVQIHTYGAGAAARGEKVDQVAIVGMPRQGTTLDEMFVWSEPFDPSIADVALKRVADIGEKIRHLGGAGSSIANAGVAKAFAVAKDCTYCPFFLKGAADHLQHGCNGKA